MKSVKLGYAAQVCSGYGVRNLFMFNSDDPYLQTSAQAENTK
jgi:hypothetical protein